MSNQFLKLRRSAVPGKVPTTSSLEFGEIALNTYDGLAFMKRSGSNGEEIVTIGSTSGSFTGSLFGTASYSIFAISSSYSTNILGQEFYVAVYNGENSLSTGSIYDSASFTAVGSTTPANPSNPERFFVDAGNTTSYNLISGHGEIDNYLQFNVQNFSYGATGSSDVVATANNGTENDNYIDMGINNSGYNIQDGIGAANDAYLYSSGNDLLIGNVSDGKKIIIFNGSGGAVANARITVFDQGTVGVNSQNPSNTNPEALLVEPLPGSTNDFNNLIVGKGTVNENYLQLNIHNYGSGSAASSDVVATNDTGDEVGNYIDMGINSSNYAVPNAVGGPNDAYLYSTGSKLYIGNATPGESLSLFTGDIDVLAAQKLYLSAGDSHQLTGSLEASQGFTGSLYGTASWAENTLTASYVENAISASYSQTASYVELSQSASYVLNAESASFATNAATASSADDFIVRGSLTGSDALFTGTITAQRLNVQYITASTEIVTGSTKFGSQLTDTHQFTGSVFVTNSLTVNGSLIATSSWAQNAVTASFVTLAQTASYVLRAVSSSFASTASFVQLAQTASYVQTAQTASYVLNAVSSSFASTASFVTLAQTASYVLNAVSSSFASTASFVTLAQTASFVSLAQTASYVLQAVSSSFASTASFVVIAQTASYVQTAQTASYVLQAVSASFATTAQTASYVQLAQSASYVQTAQTASFVTASNVYGPYGSNSILTASYAVTAAFALNAGGGASITVADEGNSQGTATFFNFTGAGVTATVASNTASINIPGGTGDTFPYTGSAIISGSLRVTGSVSSTGGFTGSLLGTASWAENAITASYVQLAQSASYVLNAVSSSFASTASYLTLAQSASYVLQAVSASFATTASYALSSSFATTSSFATSASYSVSSSYAQTASYGINIVISGSINNADYIQFNTSSTVTDAVGRLYYNSGEGTLNVGLVGGNVVANIGEDLYQYIYNATGAPLTKGQVVYISGSQGNRIAVKLASATAEQGSANTIGFVAEAIGTGAEGWVITEGVLRKINTTGLIAGQLLYLSTTPGAYTQTEPEAPYHGVRLGYPERIDNTVGSIYVKIDNGWELGEIHDVIDTTTTSSYGDLLVKSGSAWHNSKQLTGSYGLTGSLSLISGSIALSKGIDPGAAVTNTAYLFASASEDGTSTDLYYRHSGNLWNFDWYENITDTGIIYGGIVSFTGSAGVDTPPRATEVRITPGLGLLLNHNVTTSSKGESVATLVPFGPITQSFKDFITSSQVAYLYIDQAGQLQTQTSVFNVDQYHQSFPLGVIFALTTSSISSYGDQRTTNYGQQQQAGEFIRAFGPLKVSGYDLTPQSGSLKLSIAAGTTFRFGGFYSQDPETPSNYDSSAVATGSLFRVYRDPAAVGGFRAQTNAGLPFTDIDPTKWDDGSGTLKTVGSGEFTIQRLFQAAVQGVTYVYYGQAKYTSLATAIQNITAEQFTESPTSIAALPFIGYVITEGTSTNLADTGSNRVINSGLFRNTAGSSGGGGAAVTSLNDLSDVNISGPSNGEALVYNSGVWINSSTVNSASFSTSASLAQSASYVLQAVSASFATTASFVTLAQTASFVTTAQTASYILNAVSSSFSSTASFITLAQTASFVTLAQTSSYVLTAQTASYVNLAQTASFVATASWANNARTASFVTASDVFGPFGANSVITASYAVTAAFALNAGAATSITVAEEGTAQGTATFFNFIGAGVTVAPVSSNTASITIPGGGGSTFPYTGSAQITGSLGVTGSVSVIQGGFTGSLFGTASYVTGSIFTSTNPALTASFATTASYVLQAVSASYATAASYSLATKAGNVTAGTFTGNPRKATVTFGSAFPNTSYAITITGEDSRTWSIESKLAGSFVINTNSNTALAGTTYWIATQYNS